MTHQFPHRLRGNSAQHRLHLGQSDLLAAVGHQLIQQAHRVAHASRRAAGDEFQRHRLHSQALLLGDVLQVADHILEGNTPEVEALATREDSVRNLAGLGGNQDEDHMRGRFFQRFQQSVEGRLGQHVDLIEDVDLVVGLAGPEAHLLPDAPHLINPSVRCSVYLDEIQQAPLIDGLTDEALVTGLVVLGGQAVDCFGQESPH